MLHHPLARPSARLKIVVGEKICFHDVGALRGRERNVPPALQSGNCFESVEQALTGKQFAPLYRWERIESKLTGDNQLR